MAEYDKHFFKETIWRYWKEDDYKDLDDNEKFEKLYCYVLELEERIEQLEKKNDDDDFYYQEQQEKNP